MMAGLFLLLTIEITTLYFKKRAWGMWILIVTLVLAAFLLWYHMTSVLQIKW